jgi:6-pyruvoyltetrahydropterin/6-carboxytetrahydropterin synthase
MKISKEFRWEMGHRLPFHEGLCKNLHGHSYKMELTIEGSTDKNGMIIDFYDLGKIVKPVLEKYDHAFMCWYRDTDLKNFLTEKNLKRVIVKYHSTVENISREIGKEILYGLKNLGMKNIKAITVKIFETPNSFAESGIKL